MVNEVDDVSPVRADEALDWTRLVGWLRGHLAACDVPGLDVSRQPEVLQFPGGHSNLTYLIRFGQGEIVVRRPPLGLLAPRAHDMAREFRWLSALHEIFAPAPRPYVLCEDKDVIGSVFYAMERRRGLVVRSAEPAALADNVAARRAASRALVDTLADLHALDVTREGLSGLGKPEGFVERQVRGWTDRWHRSKTTPLAEMDDVAKWLLARLPPDAAPAVVHGDFKLDNVMLDPLDPGRVVAVLDWEMSALGDPLVDLGILLAYWTPTAPGHQRDALTTVTHRPGYFTRDEVVERYAQRSKRDLSLVPYYEIFAVFKIAVVIQQIYYRWAQGQTLDSRFATFEARVATLARQAAERAAVS